MGCLLFYQIVYKKATEICGDIKGEDCSIPFIGGFMINNTFGKGMMDRFLRLPASVTAALSVSALVPEWSICQI